MRIVLKFIIFLIAKELLGDPFLFLGLEITGCSEFDPSISSGSKLDLDTNSGLNHYINNQKKTLRIGKFIIWVFDCKSVSQVVMMSNTILQPL